ncbi:unnamed protein product [Arctogadus glacialis]
MFFLFNPDLIEDRRELVEVRKKAELGLLDVAVTPTSKCGKGQRREIPNSKNLEPSEDGNDEHVAEPKTKSKRKQASTAQSASKSILQKYKNAQLDIDNSAITATETPSGSTETPCGKRCSEAVRQMQAMVNEMRGIRQEILGVRVEMLVRSPAPSVEQARRCQPPIAANAAKPSTPLDVTDEDESASNYSVIISQSVKSRSSRTSAQKFVNDLMHGIYSTEYMATHSVSGLSSTKAANVKAALPRDHVMEIIAEARKVFPEAAEDDIRHFMREKLSNAAKILRRKEKSDRT